MQLAQPFIADHFNPRLTRHAHALTLGIDLSEEFKGKISVSDVGGSVRLGAPPTWSRKYYDFPTNTGILKSYGDHSASC